MGYRQWAELRLAANSVYATIADGAVSIADLPVEQEIARPTGRERLGGGVVRDFWDGGSYRFGMGRAIGCLGRGVFDFDFLPAWPYTNAPEAAKLPAGGSE